MKFHKKQKKVFEMHFTMKFQKKGCLITIISDDYNNCTLSFFPPTFLKLRYF